MHRILNLGAGTQSSVILLLADRGELEPIDLAVFADTGWEPVAVYEHLEWLKSEVSIPIVTVSQGNIYEDAMVGQGKRFASMPLFVLNGSQQGMIRRQCTQEYKVGPIERYIRQEILGLRPRQRWPKDLCITQLFGLSTDELARIKPSRRNCVVHSYPLIEQKRWGRRQTIAWSEEHYPERVFPRSACCG